MKTLKNINICVTSDQSGTFQGVHVSYQVGSTDDPMLGRIVSADKDAVTTQTDLADAQALFNSILAKIQSAEGL